MEVVYKMQHLGLRSATTMDHTLYVSTVLLEDFTDDRGIGTGWRKHQLSYSKRASLDPIGQTITSGINQI